jgi:hypothetical protein
MKNAYKLFVENLKGRDNLGQLVVISNHILEIYSVKLWVRLYWFGVQS